MLYAPPCFEWKFFVLVYGFGSFSGPGSDLVVAVVTVAALASNSMLVTTRLNVECICSENSIAKSRFTSGILIVLNLIGLPGRKTMKTHHPSQIPLLVILRNPFAGF